MFKDFKFNQEARDAMLAGMAKVSDAVGCTLGPNGDTVVLCDTAGQPKVTKDGVTVAKEIELMNFFENAGAQLLKEAAVRTVNTVGDSTTTSTILGYYFCKEINSLLNQGYTKTELRSQIKHAAEVVIDFIKSQAIAIDEAGIENIATISANNDPELGKLISDVFKAVGKDGIITVEESNNSKTFFKHIDGMQFERGYAASHFVTDSTKDQCILENPVILITEHKLLRLKDIANILNPVVEQGRSILIIAESYDDATLEALKLNKLNGTLKVCAIETPSYGDYRKAILEDIAILTGGFNISYDSGLELTDATPEMLGSCKKVIITKDKTTIMNGKGDPAKLLKRTDDIRAELDRVKQDPTMQGGFLEKTLSERLAKLTGGICVIYVGGSTELEMRERKDRVDDAVCATQAAIEEGIVPGGGTVYLRAAKELNDTPGEKGIADVLKAPFNIIVSSSGNNPNLYADLVEHNAGFNALTGYMVPDMIKSGIVDPVKAVRLAFENAISVALLFLNTECIVTPKVVQ